MNKIDHIGIAVKSLAEALPAWVALLADNPRGQEEVPSEGVRVAFFGEGPGRIELLEPTRPDSPIARHLERRGPGIHHVCLAVDDLDAALGQATAAGLEVLPPGARDGAGGRRVAFLHPKSASGVLVELSAPGTDEGA
ncbi:MAG: methylmalonyl-CoA epimerase [Gemmatimonadota bacterium]|nr:methylmalonyl-CoA epimerase [Gemmatimonadota bacterium]